MEGNVQSLLKKFIPLGAFKETIVRFPLSVLCSLGLFTIMVLIVHDVIDFDGKLYLAGRLITLFACGYLWFVIMRLVATARNWSTIREYAVAFTVFAFFAWVLFTLSGYGLVWLLMPMFAALLLLVPCMPFQRGANDAAFWGFCLQYYNGALFAVVAGLLWGGGLAISLASIEYLFEIDFPSELYGDLWCFALLILTPLYALTYLSEPEESDQIEIATHLKFLVQRALVPLVIVYSLILYAYFGKIALAQSLPRGQLAYLVTGFGSVGVLTWFLGWRIREEGGTFLRLFYRFFFPALLLPVAMQALALYLRVDQYGLTEARYYVGVSVLWLGMMAVLYSVRNPPLKTMFLSLALMLMVASVGPLSALSVSAHSQINRLEMLLTKHQILVDGKLQAAPAVVPFADRKSISSILRYLKKRDQLSRIEHWLSDVHEGDQPLNPTEWVDLMGIEEVFAYQTKTPRQNVRIHNNLRRKTLDVSGFDLATHFQNVCCAFATRRSEAPWIYDWDSTPALNATYADGILSIQVADAQPFDFDIEAYVVQALQQEPKARQAFMEQQIEDTRVRVLIDELSAVERDEQTPDSGYTLDHMTFMLLVDLPDKE